MAISQAVEYAQTYPRRPTFPSRCPSPRLLGRGGARDRIPLSISYGAPLVVVIGLKQESRRHSAATRSSSRLPAALVWVGTGMGGILG